MLQLISSQTWFLTLLYLVLAKGSTDVPPMVKLTQGVKEVKDAVQQVPEVVKEVTETVQGVTEVVLEVPDVLYLVLSQPGEHHAAIANLTAQLIRLVRLK